MNKFLLFLLKSLARLPFWGLYCLSDIISFILYHLVGYRKKIVRKNLTEAFPEKSKNEIKDIEKKFYRYLSDQIVETVKLFHISDQSLISRVKVNNAEIINDTMRNGRNAVLLMGHYNNWEWVQEITRYFLPDVFMVSIYHPMKDKFWENAFIELRNRWGANIVPMPSAPRTLLNKANFPWVCGFIADQRPGQRSPENCMQFLNHKMYFIYGPEVIGDKVKAEYFYLEMLREKRGRYIINFHKLEPEDKEVPYPYTREFWKEFGETIKKYPPYWLWSHNRWKLQPEDMVNV
ncbi:MAG: lysophospholipid acyltransferase family protein [Muribaculaceae bacterium]|nr:lysophospholipid acyltransferase family protein [Muribaculaceae bacterium]